MAKGSGSNRLPAPLLLLGIGITALVLGLVSLIREDARYAYPLYWPDLISHLASLYSLGGLSTLEPVPRPLSLQIARFLGSIFSLLALGAGLRALMWEHLGIFRAAAMKKPYDRVRAGGKGIRALQKPGASAAAPRGGGGGSGERPGVDAQCAAACAGQ